MVIAALVHSPAESPGGDPSAWSDGTVTDDWQWFWANEQGRDRILRDEVEVLNARLASADSRTRGLSSQLASLTGSLENRLNALSTAFDAYVELGDVREQLSAYETQAAVRRDVAKALEALADGRPAEPVDSRGLDYWLPYAMNATIAVATGRRDLETEARARSLSPEADLFLVAACGALGRGDRVVDKVANLLIADSTLTMSQLRLFGAASEGLYGDVAALLEPVLRPAIAAEPTSSWAGWVTGEAGSSPSQAVAWIADLIAERPGDDMAEAAGAAQTQLREIVTELVGRGMPEEAGLLARARELRARIERPDGSPSTTAEEKAVTVMDEIRRTVTADSTLPELHRALLGWLAEPLSAVVAQVTQQAASEPVEPTIVRRAGTDVVVTADGAEPEVVDRVVTQIRATYQLPRQPIPWWIIGAVVAVLFAAVLVINDSVVWAVLFGLVAAGCGYAAVRQRGRRRQQTIDEAAAVTGFAATIEQATERAANADHARAELLTRLSAEAAEVRSRLAALSPAVAGAESRPDGL